MGIVYRDTILLVSSSFPQLYEKEKCERLDCNWPCIVNSTNCGNGTFRGTQQSRTIADLEALHSFPNQIILYGLFTVYIYGQTSKGYDDIQPFVFSNLYYDIYRKPLYQYGAVRVDRC